MNKEEKEAIEILRNFEPDDLVECSIYIQAVEKITNLIDKQQKEIEEYKKNYISRYTIEYLLDDYISKDKIKEKIEELKQYKEEIKEEKDFEYFTTLRIIRALKELLGE